MQINWTYKPEAVWWNTALAIPLALLLFLPGMAAGYVVAWLQKLLTEGYIGETGHGIGWFMRGLQFSIAAGSAVYLPHLLLRSSNSIIVASVLSTLLISFFIFATLVVGAHHSFHEWLEFVASNIGIGVGAAAAAGSVVEAQHGWRR